MGVDHVLTRNSNPIHITNSTGTLITSNVNDVKKLNLT